MNIMLEQMTPLFAELFSEETARALSKDDTLKLMSLIQGKIATNKINSSAAVLFFLRLIAPTLQSVSTTGTVQYDSQGFLLKESAFMKLAAQLLQKLVAEPLNPLKDLHLSPESAKAVTSWLEKNKFDFYSIIKAALALEQQ